MVILTAKLVAAVKGCKELLVTKKKLIHFPNFPGEPLSPGAWMWLCSHPHPARDPEG